MYSLHKLFPKVAIVADQMTSFGGADREMISILKVFPNAHIFTVLFYKEKYPMISNKVYTSFVQKYTKIFGKKFSRHLKIFNPLAYESFSFEGYDLVISISAGPAKAVITGINQPHLAMVMTPPRSLWDNELNARASKFHKIYRWLSNILNTYLRVWDISISKRVDYWSSNSEFVARKIRKTYGVIPKVLYPGIEERYFEPVTSNDIEKVKEKYSVPEDFVLVVSRLYDYKRVDWAIRAAQRSGKNLVIVGEGPDLKFLKKIAKGDSRIQFLGFISDDEVKALYTAAKVLLFCGIEDFGLVPLEAMAAGTLVFAYKYGGVLETVSQGKSGEFFENEEQLAELLKKLDERRYNKKDIVNQARKFSEEKFLNNFTEYIKQIHEKESSQLAQ